MRKRAAFQKQTYKGCPYEGCARAGAQMTQKAILRHIEDECLMRGFNCPLCSDKVDRKGMKEHFEIGCMMVMIKCEICKVRIG